MRRILALLVVLFFVVGCGGGGGSGDSNVQLNPDPVDSVEVPMCSEILDDRGAIRLDLLCNEDGSIIFETDGLFVDFNCILPNGNQSEWALDDEFIEGICAEGFNQHIFLPMGDGSNEREDNFETCPTPDELDKFVNTFRPVNRFDVAPVLSFADSSTEYHKQLVRDSVSFLNRALPDEYDIAESGADVEGSEGGALQVPQGEIYIQFFPERPNVPVGLAVGRYIRITGGAEHEIGGSSALRLSYVLFIAHEIMHVLGFSGHIDLPTDSIMMDGNDVIQRFVTDRNWPRVGILAPVDVWGIRYFYEDATQDPGEWLADRCN